MPDDPTPNWDLLDKIATAPDSQLDATMVDKLKALKGKTTEEVKTGLHEILDLSAHGSLASDFVMRVLDHEWKRIGGKLDDPAPWQKNLGIEPTHDAWQGWVTEE